MSEGKSLYVYIEQAGGTHLAEWQGEVTTRSKADTDIFVLRRNHKRRYEWIYACSDPTPQLAAEKLRQRGELRVGDIIVDRMEGSVHDEVLIVRAAHKLNRVKHLALRNEALAIAKQAQEEVRARRTPEEFSWHYCEYTPAKAENSLNVGDSAGIRSSDRMAIVCNHDSVGPPTQEFVVVRRDRMAVGFQSKGEVVSTHETFVEAQRAAMERVNDSWGYVRLQQEAFHEFNRPKRLLDKAMERDQQEVTSSVKLSLAAWEEPARPVAESDKVVEQDAEPRELRTDEPRTWVMRFDGRSKKWSHVVTAKTHHIQRVQERVSSLSGGAQTGDLYLCSNGKAFRQKPNFTLEPDNSTAVAVLHQQIRDLRAQQQSAVQSQHNHEIKRGVDETRNLAQ